jgi:hypothetical protein
LTKGHLVVYLDDILLFHHALEDPRVLVYETTTKYLGVLISEGNVHIDPAKVSGITQWPLPQTIKEIQSLLDFCNFLLKRFIYDYSKDCTSSIPTH